MKAALFLSAVAILVSAPVALCNSFEMTRVGTAIVPSDVETPTDNQSGEFMKQGVKYQLRALGTWTVDKTKLVRWCDYQGYTNEEAKQFFGDADGAKRFAPQARLGALLLSTTGEPGTWIEIGPYGISAQDIKDGKLRFKINDWSGSYSDNAGNIILDIYEPAAASTKKK